MGDNYLLPNLFICWITCKFTYLDPTWILKPLMLGLGNLDYCLRGPLKKVLNFCVKNLFHTKKNGYSLSLSLKKNVNNFFFFLL